MRESSPERLKCLLRYLHQDYSEAFGPPKEAITYVDTYNNLLALSICANCCILWMRVQRGEDTQEVERIFLDCSRCLEQQTTVDVERAVEIKDLPLFPYMILGTQ